MKDVTATGNGYHMTAEDDAAALAAVRESVQPALEAEALRRPFAAQYLNAARGYYDASYSSFPPAMLATEVHWTAPWSPPCSARLSPTTPAPNSADRRLAVRPGREPRLPPRRLPGRPDRPIHRRRLGTAAGDTG